MTTEEPPHLIAEPGLLPSSAAAAVLLIPSFRMNSESEDSQYELALLRPHRFGAHPGHQAGAAMLPNGSLLIEVPADITKVYGPLRRMYCALVAGVAAGQAAQRHHPRHEAEISVRFAGPNQAGSPDRSLGEVVHPLRRGFAELFHRTAQIEPDGFTDRNQAVPFARHALFSHVPVTEGARVQRRGE